MQLEGLRVRDSTTNSRYRMIATGPTADHILDVPWTHPGAGDLVFSFSRSR